MRTTTKELQKVRAQMRGMEEELTRAKDYAANMATMGQHIVEYECIMAVFTLSLWTTQVWAIYVNSVKGSCPKSVTI